MTKLQEMQQELYHKQNNIQTIYDQSKLSDGTYDFVRADAFTHLADGRDHVAANAAAIDVLRQLEKEAQDLHGKTVALQELHESEEKNRRMIADRKRVVDTHTHADGNGQLQPQVKSLGTLVRETWPDDSQPRRPGEIFFQREFKNWDIRQLGMGDFETKTIMTTAAGWAPQAVRIPRIAEMAMRPISVIDLFPIGNTTQAAIVWMEETTSTNTAAEKAENVAAVEATEAFTERTSTIRRIPVFITVSDEQVADVDQVSSLIDTRLRYFVQARLDSQLLVGDGNAPNIQGLLNASIGSRSGSGEDTTDAIYKGMVLVQLNGRATPSAIVIHPTNFQPVRLMRANGMYVWGHPSVPGPMTMWGVPVAVTDAITLNTAVVGDFVNHAQVWMRQGVEISVGYHNDYFIKSLQVIRATLRATLAVYRPLAFEAITNLT